MNRKGYFVVMVVIVISIFLFYLKEQENTFTSKVVNYNGNNLRISIDGVNSNTLPTSGTYYLASYDCKSVNTVVTWDQANYQLKVSNQGKQGGVACYLDFQSKPKLSDMAVGSYVTYTGNNGCSGAACSGQNANYVSDTDMGYCNNSNYKFIVNGWRIGYIQDGSAYLISAGALECMCTNSSGTASTSCSNSEMSSNHPKHLANLDKKALTYCNASYAYGGVCDSNSAWAMDATDFNNIMGKALSSSSCHTKYSDKSCGYANDLIDNGGYYWYVTLYGTFSNEWFFWDPNKRYVSRSTSSSVYGVRPVLRLGSSVLVVGGSGTYEDPYTIANS